jgi:hypothetical protein
MMLELVAKRKRQRGKGVCPSAGIGLERKVGVEMAYLEPEYPRVGLVAEAGKVVDP